MKSDIHTNEQAASENPIVVEMRELNVEEIEATAGAGLWSRIKKEFWEFTLSY